MNFEADNNIFFSDFGIPAVIQQPGQPDKPVTIIFALNSLDTMGVLTDKPQIVIADADLIDLDLKTGSITVTGKYPAARITKPLPDGFGIITAFLIKI